MLARYEFTGFWAGKAVDFIRRHKAGPFFVELWPQDVHTPHVPDPEKLPTVAGTPKPHRKFNAVLRRYDREIGRVLDFLKAEGLEQNTIIVFSADNGPEPSFQRQRAGGLECQGRTSGFSRAPMVYTDVYPSKGVLEAVLGPEKRP